MKPTTLFSLEGKVVVITGAGGTLGTYFCGELLAAGATVVAIDATSESLDRLLQKFADKQLVVHLADVRDRAAIAAVRNDTLNRFSQVDGLINNAATKSTNFFDAFETFPLADWDLVMSVNLTGAMVCCQEFGGHMALSGKGSIINVLSIYGFIAPDQRIYEGSEYLGRAINTPAVYCASKAGLWGLTLYLSSYWANRGVRINALTPGGIFSGQNQTFVDRYSQRVPMNRMGEPRDLIGAVIYLLSDNSGYMTGQNLIVDGGLSAW